MLTVLAAPLGTLGLAATAQATPTPPLTITSPAPDSTGTAYSNASNLAISFSGAGAGDTVTVSADYSSISGSTTAGSDGTGTINVVGTPSSGDTVTITDAARSASETLEYDNTPMTSLNDYGSNENVSDGGTAQSGASFDVNNGIPNEPAALFLDGNTTPAATATADSDGNVDTLAPANGFTPGYHSAVIRSQDADGNYGPATTTLHFYVAPPAPSYVSPPPSAGDWPYINQSKPTFTVSGVLPGATVNLYQMDQGPNQDTNVRIGSVISPNGGTVAVTATTAVADGFDNFAVTQAVTEGTGPNAQSVESDWIDAQTAVAVDTAAPVLSTDFYGSSTNESQPTFSISVPDLGSDANSQWEILDASDHVVGQTSLDNPSWTPSTPLADGNYSFHAVTIDAAGETSAPSDPISFTVDTVAPSVPSVTAPANGSTVTTNEPTVTVHGDPGTAMTAIIDYGTNNEVDLYGQSADSNGNTTYALTQPLSSGQHTLTVYSGDDAGNYSSSQPITFTVNTSGANAGGGSTPPTPAPSPAPTPTTPKPAPKPASAPPAPKAVNLSSHTVSAGHPVKVGFTVSKPSTVVLTVTKTVHKKTKVKVHGKTKTITKTVITTVGKVSVKVKKAGKGSFTLTNKLAGHKLAKGSYTLVLQTTSGKATSKAVTTKLSVR